MFDTDNRLLKRGDDVLAAPPRVLGVLDLLLERAGDLVARQELIDRVWKDAFVTDTSLAEAVSALRQTLGDDPQAPTYIQTVHRRGYRFVAAVEARSRPAPAPAVTVPERASEVVSPSIGGQLLPWSLAALCMVAAAAAIFQLARRPEQVVIPGRFALELQEGLVFDRHRGAIALARDGRMAVWSACGGEGCRLYARALDRLEQAPIPGTDGATAPFFAPDGRSVAFFAAGALKRVTLAGGPPVVVSDVAEPRGGVWTRDGRIIFGSGLAGGLTQVPAEGGAATALTLPRQEEGEVRHAWPSLSPDERTLFFSVFTTLADDGPGRIAGATLQGRAPLDSWSTLTAGAAAAAALASDLVLLSRGSELQLALFDPLRRVLAGAPQSLVSGVAEAGGQAQFAVSPSGTVVYLLPGEASPNVPRLHWLPEGAADPGVPDLDVSGEPVLSPDGRRLAWSSSADGARSDIRVADLARGAVTRLTHDGSNESPVWSADGRRLFFARREARAFALASVDAEGGAIRLLTSTPQHLFPGSAAGDGRSLAVVSASRDTRSDIWLVPTDGGPGAPVVSSTFDEVRPALSPDAALIAYQSDEGGRWDVYVHRLRDGRRVVVSTGGGTRPFWTAEGALMYQAHETLMRAAVNPDSLIVGSATRVAPLGNDLPIGIAPDGRILVLRRPAFRGHSAVLALHWDREARRLLGPPETKMPR